MKVVGITGPIGSGKDTVSEYLEDRYGFRELSFGDMVRGIAREKDLEPNRENLQEIQRGYRDRYGDEYFGRRIAEKMEKSEGGKFVLSGVRRPEDFEPLKKKHGEDFYLLLVDAKPKIRFRRLRKRGRPGDPDTFEEFRKQDEEEKERFDMEKTFREADYEIYNNGTLEDLKKKIDGFVKDSSLK